HHNPGNENAGCHRSAHSSQKERSLIADTVKEARRFAPQVGLCYAELKGLPSVKTTSPCLEQVPVNIRALQRVHW
ncbi:MAG TPA: hypothetical protein PKW73_13230, partial [Candidatus Obscuribacter sp.]|nr:hypothetical protein [Candidatus Obscuribacter sp.]